MKIIDIKDRIDDLLYPELDEVVEKLKDTEIDYFIQHMVSDIQKSIKIWRLKTKNH